jgi:tetratricopeptide (TPR) repeat protein
VIIAVLTAATLRGPGQVRRLQHAVIITSLPIAIYGVIQHYGIDPLPWGGDVQTRVAANAGNAIFLAAYLIMAFFLTLERVFASFVRLLGIGQPPDADAQDWQTSIAGGAYLFVLLVQTIAIFWTQSRGPWLGWLLGIYLFILLTLATVRPRRYKWFMGWVVGVGLAGVLFLIAVNTVPALAPVREMPYIGRLTGVLELEGGTGKVRALIWQGASQMLQPHEPLNFPDGSKDAINILRPLVGYGPEAMWVAFNPFYPPDLAHVEARNASPDRSHNETWDSLVITGLLGFAAYMTVFIAIFYWALRWLHLIVKRRDTILFGALLAGFAVASVAGFYYFDDRQLRLFGVALPFGLMAGYAVYISIAAFLHGDVRPDRADLPRQMWIIALLMAIVAHYLEIHFGIAIGATRTHFWIFAAALLVIGMRLAQVVPGEVLETAPEPIAPPPVAPAAASGKGGKGKGRNQPLPQAQARPAAPAPRVRRHGSNFPIVPTTVMTDVLVFLTFVYIYTTNGAGLGSTLQVLFNSIFQRVANGVTVTSPAIFFLMVFTWLVATTVGLAGESLSRRRAASLGWWLVGYGVSAVIVWGSWLVYGLLQSGRLTPFSPPAGATQQEFLNLQLERVGGHFGLFTFVVVAWILAAGTVYAWPALQQRTLAVARRPLVAAGVGVVMTALAVFAVYTVNVNLVKADIVYKQGQQFDAQGNWVNSVELYKRALATRKTEDHYMLFLGRALLEQAKQAQPQGTVTFPQDANLDDVLALTPDQVAQMGREDLLRAAETVLMQAQRVNPLNTDHTANLARLYRTWADLRADDPAVRAEMLTKSVALYDKAVTLSPNAAHLWNERGNALAADGKNDQALASYEKSLSLDQIFDQTYLLLADFLDRTGQTDKLIAILNQGIDTFDKIGNPAGATQLLSYLGVARARQNDLDGAAEANRRVLELAPGNVGALRNLAIIARDQGKPDEALSWLDQALAAAAAMGDGATLKQLYQFAAELYQAQGNTAAVVEQYEKMRQVDPSDVTVLQTLSNLYNSQQNDAKVFEIAQALVQADPQNYVHPLNAAQALIRMQRGQEALPYLQQARGLAPAEQQPAIDTLIQQVGGS